jgi:hypothetical protein
MKYGISRYWTDFSVTPGGFEHEKGSFIRRIHITFALPHSNLGPYTGFLRELFELRYEFSGMQPCSLLDAGTSMIDTQQHENEKSGVCWI